MTQEFEDTMNIVSELEKLPYPHANTYQRWHIATLIRRNEILQLQADAINNLQNLDNGLATIEVAKAIETVAFALSSINHTIYEKE